MQPLISSGKTENVSIVRIALLFSFLSGFVNDFGQTSFLKINGVMIKFTQTDFEEIGETKTIAKSKSNDYELTVEINAGHESGYETSKHTGTIKLTDKKGNSITRKFYGLCGC